MSENITLTQDDVQKAITFLEQFLSDKLPDADFGLGTSNRDISINSMALTLAYMRQEIENVRNRQSLKTLQELPESESVDEAVDEILSNWFVNRKIGEKSHGVVTLHFSTDEIGTVHISEEDVVRKTSSLVFNANEGTKFLTKEDLTKNVSNAGVVYYTAALSVMCDAEGDNNLDTGTFESWSISSPYLYKIENLSSFTGGDSIESTDDLIKRSESVITVRDLNTTKSIRTVLQEAFTQVQDLTVIGYGELEMQRDLIDALSGSGTVSIHRGSMMDIWVLSPLNYGVSATVTPSTFMENGSPVTYFSLPAEPVLRINSLVDAAVTPQVDVSYTLEVVDTTKYLSERQETKVYVKSSYSGAELTLNYDTISGYEELQDYVEDSNNRILVADPLIKSLHPMYLKFGLRYAEGALPLDVEAAKAALQYFVHSYSPKEELSVSEITSYFQCQYAEYVSRLEYPVKVEGTLYLSNGDTITTLYEDRLEIPERYAQLVSGGTQALFDDEEEPLDSTVITSTDIQLSNRTTRYVLPLENITISVI